MNPPIATTGQVNIAPVVGEAAGDAGKGAAIAEFRAQF